MTFGTIAYRPEACTQLVEVRPHWLVLFIAGLFNLILTRGVTELLIVGAWLWWRS